MQIPLFFEDTRYWIRVLGLVAFGIGVAWRISVPLENPAEAAMTDWVAAHRLVASSGMLQEAGYYVMAIGATLFGLSFVKRPQRK